MCGIVGVRRFDGAPVDGGLLRAMASRLGHRGPDADGFWQDGAVGFGHRRLSIIDVAGSPQPMSSPDGRLHLCFNGEILNYRELRSRISYPFRTDGDTETLLAVFHQLGDAAVHQLTGQFAFALHDSTTGDLTLHRDRLGILPLYYFHNDRMLAFASEIKALLPALPGGPEVDEASLDEYLAQRSVPAPYTMFKNVRKLPAAHRLVAHADGRVDVHRYWSIPEATGTARLSDRDAVEELDAALRRAVAATLVADVPVGSYLSGGLDSSLVVAMMSGLRDGAGVETFAAGFGDPRHDELAFARQVSDRFGTRHHEVLVTPQDFVDLWPRLTWHRDAPMSEPADFAVHQLARLARRHVKVVLSGEGSDELFGGYPKHLVGPLLRPAGLVPAAVRVPLVRAAETRLPAAAARARIALRVLGAPTEDERMRAWFAPFTAAERAELVGRWDAHPRPVLPPVRGGALQRMLAADCQGWLPDNLLERGDRMSMAASLELRPPFLDHRLVELAFSLPARMKIRGRTRKWILKEVARSYLPPGIVDRRKVGFRVPLERWFRGELESMARDMLLSRDSLVATRLERGPVIKLLDRHRAGRANEESRIWTLLSLEVWNQVFFHAPQPATADADGTLPAPTSRTLAPPTHP